MAILTGLVPPPARKAAEEEESDQGDDQADPEAPDEHQDDPDDDDDPADRDPAGWAVATIPCSHAFPPREPARNTGRAYLGFALGGHIPSPLLGVQITTGATAPSGRPGSAGL